MNDTADANEQRWSLTGGARQSDADDAKSTTALAQAPPPPNPTHGRAGLPNYTKNASKGHRSIASRCYDIGHRGATTSGTSRRGRGWTFGRAAAGGRAF
ncbi:hypothetical protein EVAR_37237_1 [Eumeta japonica]|uniref:Uncharacterized protein n=1 Tax=Eumeta variegata TaxID=151549 RepID=A0A4C1Y8G6_EUMVA|nr:hypothetical protein EVAR_37237_1 [Eumeta japonica]